MSISLNGLSKSFGDTHVLDDLSLSVERQSFAVLCGPPGAGKSVLFRLLVGLEKPDAGTMVLNGEDITGTSAAQRAIGYVPQSFALYPHLTVHDNIGYPLKLAKRPSDEISKRVDWAAGVLSITHLLKKTPDQLSGGEKQRTAVARGLLKDADIFLLDDPLVGLDYKLRERLMDELKGLQRELKATFLYATSDSLEALTMAEQMIVLDQGKVVQQDDVFSVYRDPAHIRAMELVGFPRCNMLPLERADGSVKAGPFTLLNAPEEASSVGFRPEAMQIGEKGGLSAQATIRLVEDLGGEHVVYADSGNTSLTMAAPAGVAGLPTEGDNVEVTIQAKDLMFFDGQTGQRVAASGKESEA